MKACKRCGETHELSFFNKQKDTKDRLHSYCKNCTRAASAASYRKPGYAEAKIAALLEKRKTDPEAAKRHREAAKRYISKPEKKAIASAYKAERWKEDRIKEKDRERRSTEAYKEARRKRARERHQSDPMFALRMRISNLINQSLRNKGGKRGSRWEVLLGYTKEELKSHLEAQFKKGMTWENAGEWHIDHIVPVASFTYESATDPEFKACWALTNLRPLWAKENLTKKDKRVFLL